MRITSDSIGMESARSFTSRTKKELRHESFMLSGDWLSDGGTSTLMKEGEKEQRGDVIDTGGEADAITAYQKQLSRLRSPKMTERSIEATMDQIRQSCLSFILKLFDLNSEGKKENAGDVVADGMTQLDSDLEFPDDAEFPTMETFSAVDKLDRWVFTSEYYEEENTSFSTKGSVVTADGREISFNMEISMSRSFMQKTGWTYEKLSRNVSLCDPLVINLDDTIASLSDQKFMFDINGDGKEESISRLESSSGYLALDLNENGTIDDGSELFGTSSGNGFKDLAKYDEDGNGWIDENDEIWSKLLIWCKNENGEDILYHLADKGVGAICLKNEETDYKLATAENNQTNGYIRRTGLFLYESGAVGSMQHVDVAMQA